MGNVKSKKKYTIASLFSGIGGIDLGFKSAGFDIIWANEIDLKSCKTYKNNFKNEELICDDIKNLKGNELKKVDILTGGFPCQAFSIAGNRKGFKDKRGALIFEVFRIIKDLKPKIIFLENVKNLKTHNNGKTFNTIINNLIKLGYFVKYKILNTCKYSDVPQNRERLYIVGFKSKNKFKKFDFPEVSNRLLSIQDILEKKVSDNFYYTNTKYYSILKKTMKNKNTCYQWRRKYVRENKNNLCPTLTATMGTGGHNVPLVIDNFGIRKLTPRECLRLQGFPDNFVLPKDLPNSVLYKQAGNSVTVPIIKKIAEKIMEVLNV